MAAALSPDGRTIAIDLLGTLWTMPAAGGAAKPITDIVDGRAAAVVVAGQLAHRIPGVSQQHLADLDDQGGRHRPARVTSGPFDDREPSWSPDGRPMAFASDRSGTRRARGRPRHWRRHWRPATTQVTADRPTSSIRRGAASNEIAFVSDRRERPGVYVVAAALGDERNERLVAASDGAVAGPVFAPDGTSSRSPCFQAAEARLMIGDRNIADADEDVFPFRPQWISPTEFSIPPTARSNGDPRAGGPARTSSSQRMCRLRVRHSHRSAGRSTCGTAAGAWNHAPGCVARRHAGGVRAVGDLWTMPIGGAPQRVTHDSSLETDPAWSPDGKSLAYSSDRDGFMNIWVRDLQSGADRQVTHGTAAAMQSAWSPDGSRIAFSDPDGQIQIVDVKSGVVSRGARSLNEAGRASWAPDGRSLVVSSLEGLLDAFSRRHQSGSPDLPRRSAGSLVRSDAA